MAKIKIQNNEVEILQLRLKDWSKLEGLKQELDAATTKQDFDLIFLCMVKFVEAAISSPKQIKWEELPWYEFIEIYSETAKANSPTIEFPILRGSGEKDKKQPWEYDGRSWYFWLNLFAKNYGWNEEIIADLDIDSAIGLYQELQIDEQMGREWEWGLSEIAYPYEKSTKSSKFKPLRRPGWMMPIVPKQLPVIKIRRDHLPVGNVVDLQEEVKKRRRGTKNA